MVRSLSGKVRSLLTYLSVIVLLLMFFACQQESEPIPQIPGIEQPVTENPTKPDTSSSNPDTTTVQPDPNDCMVTAGADHNAVIPNQYIVTYQPSPTNGLEINGSAVDRLLSKHSISASKLLKTFEGLSAKGFVAKLTPEEIQQLKKDPGIQNIEEDRIVSITSGCYTEASTQKIPWGINRVGFGDGTGKTAWIIDTGIDVDHQDLKVDRSRSISFIPGTTVDDDHGHGTHVAGTIGAKNNNIGVVGVAANATLIALKVMNKEGKGTLSNVIAAVAHIGKYAKTGEVVNMSIGGGTSKTLDEEVLRVAAKGILFAVAAGNEGTDASQSSPARINHSNIYTVSAMDQKDTYAPFSNYGVGVVDYCAPGTYISSTYLNDNYGAMSGTSMATPHVAGLLLLNGKTIKIDGYVKEDPDGKADPIAHK